MSMEYNHAYKLIRQYTLSLLHYPPLTEQIQRYGDMTAEEIVQEVSLAVFKHWDDTWDDGLIRFVTSRRVIDLYHSRKNYRFLRGEMGEWNEPFHESDGLDDLLDINQRWMLLSDKDRKLVELVVSGKGHKEIASHMDTTIGNSRDRLYQVRLMLAGKKKISTNKRR